VTTMNTDLERQAFEAGYAAGVEDCAGAHTNLAGHLWHITLACGLNTQALIGVEQTMEIEAALRRTDEATSKLREEGAERRLERQL
jgi:hypothetical protein